MADAHPSGADLGSWGEVQAERHLHARGFRTVARNWRPAGRNHVLEIDLAGEWEGYLVFVEVKTRRAHPLDESGFPPGLRNFTPAKQRAMARAARHYLAEGGLWDMPCRFDLICVTSSGPNPADCKVEHFRDVIEFGQAVDRGHAPWQP